MEIIKADFKVLQEEAVDRDNNRVRFDGVVDFPYFLIHALKVLISLNIIEHENPESKIIDELLDDKKLIKSFNRVILKGITNGDKLE